MALLQGRQVARLIVGATVHPVVVQDPDPLEGERARGGIALV